MPITKLESPCHEAWCDKCEEGSNPDGGTFHHDSEEDAISELEMMEWTIVRDEDGAVKAIYCRECVDDMTRPEKAERGIEVPDLYDQEETGVDP